MDFKNHDIISNEEFPEDRKMDLTLRPKTLDEFVGQDKLKANLKIFIKAAQQRREALDHALFHGPHGIGKTSLSHIVAREMGSEIQITSGPALERIGDLAAILTNLDEGGVLFIDECHRLNRIVEEILYPAMEEYALDIIVGKGPSAKILRLDLPRFTLIGATTRPSLLSPPLRDRFGFTHQLDFYTVDDIGKIIKRSAHILNIDIEDEAAHEIAKRSRFTPRVANRLLKRVRDFVQVKHYDKVTKDLAQKALEMLEIDNAGLNPLDRKIIKTVIEKFSGGPVGIKTIAVAIGESLDTIEEMYEPYLIQVGFLNRTPRGRTATQHAYKHLEYPPDSLQTQFKQMNL